ncbi:MAG: TolC family protein [Planctomycetota bacterium]|jgi:outer membrane protein TolC
MSLDVHHLSLGSYENPGEQRNSTDIAGCRDSVVLLMLLVVFQLTGCVSDKVEEQGRVSFYQQTLADQGPQKRADTEGRNPNQPLDLLRPVPSAGGSIIEDRQSPRPAPLDAEAAPNVAVVTDPNTGQRTALGLRITRAKRLAQIRPPATAPPDPEIIEGPADTEKQDTPPESSEPVTPAAVVPSEVDIVADPVTGSKSIELTVEQAVARTLANSPEIRVVSFDPPIAKQDVTRAASEFDMIGFGSLNYDDEDNPPNSIFQPGESEVQTWESGIRQKGLSGLEWSLSYGLTRSWDDLVGRTLPTRYEPVLSFQLKQPLLRDAGEQVTLAGVDVAKLNYKIAFSGFRDRAEDTVAQVISAYWRLLQARRGFEIQKELLDRTLDTLSKVEGRGEIDATDVQIKQTEASTKAREAALLQASKAVSDAQDVLARLMADAQMTVLDEFQIIPATAPSLEAEQLDQSTILKVAMDRNPAIQQARSAVEIADINIRVAQNQRMPRLDLVASTRTQGLARGRKTAGDVLESGDYVSYAVGLSLEIPLGNRQREAELLKRRLERRQAIAALQNVADQVAIAAKEASRRIQTNYSEMQVQKDAAEAARVHLQALEDSEPIRERLTPEFLLVKLQAQESLANAQRAEIRSVVDFNISLAELARTLGTVLELHQVKPSLPTATSNDVVIE